MAELVIWVRGAEDEAAQRAIETVAAASEQTGAAGPASQQELIDAIGRLESAIAALRDLVADRLSSDVADESADAIRDAIEQSISPLEGLGDRFESVSEAIAEAADSLITTTEQFPQAVQEGFADLLAVLVQGLSEIANILRDIRATLPGVQAQVPGAEVIMPAAATIAGGPSLADMAGMMGGGAAEGFELPQQGILGRLSGGAIHTYFSIEATAGLLSLATRFLQQPREMLAHALGIGVDERHSAPHTLHDPDELLKMLLDIRTAGLEEQLVPDTSQVSRLEEALAQLQAEAPTGGVEELRRALLEAMRRPSAAESAVAGVAKDDCCKRIVGALESIRQEVVRIYSWISRQEVPAPPAQATGVPVSAAPQGAPGGISVSSSPTTDIGVGAEPARGPGLVQAFLYGAQSITGERIPGMIPAFKQTMGWFSAKAADLLGALPRAAGKLLGITEVPGRQLVGRIAQRFMAHQRGQPQEAAAGSADRPLRGAEGESPIPSAAGGGAPPGGTRGAPPVGAGDEGDRPHGRTGGYIPWGSDNCCEKVRECVCNMAEDVSAIRELLQKHLEGRREESRPEGRGGARGEATTQQREEPGVSAAPDTGEDELRDTAGAEETTADRTREVIKRIWEKALWAVGRYVRTKGGTRVGQLGRAVQGARRFIRGPMGQRLRRMFRRGRGAAQTGQTATTSAARTAVQRGAQAGATQAAQSGIGAGSQAIASGGAVAGAGVPLGSTAGAATAEAGTALAAGGGGGAAIGGGMAGAAGAAGGAGAAGAGAATAAAIGTGIGVVIAVLIVALAALAASAWLATRWLRSMGEEAKKIVERSAGFSAPATRELVAQRLEEMQMRVYEAQQLGPIAAQISAQVRPQRIAERVVDIELKKSWLEFKAAALPLLEGLHEIWIFLKWIIVGILKSMTALMEYIMWFGRNLLAILEHVPLIGGAVKYLKKIADASEKMAGKTTLPDPIGTILRRDALSAFREVWVDDSGNVVKQRNF